MAKEKKLLSQSEYAKYRGVSKQHVSRLVKLGAIRIKDGKIDPVEADKSLDRNSEEGGNESFFAAQTRKESAIASLRELELQIKQGKYLHTETAERIWGEIISRCRSRLLAIPSRGAPLLDGKSKTEIYSVLTNLIYEALNELNRVEPTDYIAAQESAKEVDATAETSPRRVGRPKKNVEPGSIRRARNMANIKG